MVLKSRSLWTAISLLLFTFLVGCSSESSGSGSSQNPIKVGVIGAFSGPSVDMGVAMKNGIIMATEAFNENGGINGREVELVFYDDEGNSSKATTGAIKLIESENVVAILGNPNTGTSIATVKVSRKNKVPQIVPIAQSPEVLEPFSPWTFRTSATNPMDIERLIDYMKQKGWNNIGLLYDTSAYGLSGKKILEKVIPENGLKIAGSEAYTVGAPDLTAQALNLKEKNVDAVLMWGLGADEGRFVRDVAKIGWEVPILGGRGTLFEIFGKIGGEAAEGTIATGTLNLSKESAQQFVNDYKQQFEMSGSLDFAALGYDAANVLFEAFKKTGAENADDRKKVRDAIESIENFQKLITGTENASISFTADDHEGASDASVVLVEFNDGKWVPLKN